MVILYNEMSFSSRRKWSTDAQDNKEAFQKHYDRWKQPNTKDSIPCNAIDSMPLMWNSGEKTYKLLQ